MQRLRSALLVLTAALLFASCVARLPQAEVDAANLAFAEAKTAQADILAADAYKLASDANDSFQANLNAKDYRKTRSLAKVLLETSTYAARDAVAGLEAAKAEVARLGADIGAQVPALQKLYARAVAKKAKVDLKAMKVGLAAAPQALADAQGLADIVASQTALRALKASLDGYKAAFEAAGISE